jgi:drug/metabolite transporter (DMT)-like permease
MTYLIASATFTPLSHKSKILFSKNDYSILVIVSVCGATLEPLFYFMGLNQSTASNTSLLSNSEIVFTVLLALIFFKERLKPVGFVAVGLVLFGVTPKLQQTCRYQAHYFISIQDLANSWSNCTLVFR